MSNLQSHATSNANSIAQKAAVEGLTGPQEPLEAMRREFGKRRDYMAKRLNEMPGFRCLVPPGAFYCYPDVSGVFGHKVKGKLVTDDSVLASILLDEGRIAAVPGIAFGTKGYLRFSYATSMEIIEEGMNRLADVMKTME
jgi:aspartate aminotransferase